MLESLNGFAFLIYIETNQFLLHFICVNKSGIIIFPNLKIGNKLLIFKKFYLKNEVKHKNFIDQTKMNSKCNIEF